MEVVPEEVYQKRVHNAKKRNKVNSRKKHRKSGSKEPLRLKDETRTRYRFTLLIASIEPDRLPHSHALSLYRIRWQVEPVFKIWKGTCRVNEVGQMKKQRFICTLTAKLILLAIRQQLTYRLQGKTVSEAGRRAKKKIEYPVPSPNKVAKTLHELFREFYRMIRTGMSIASYAAMLETVVSGNHELERRKNKLSFPEPLFIFTCKTIK
jgi:transposase